MKHSITAKEISSTRIEIDKRALIQNLELLRGKVAGFTQVMAVIKANAYGHDADLISQLIQDYVDIFAVASVSEGVDIRKNGIIKPILVFAPVKYFMLDDCLKYNLTIVAGSFEELRMITPEIDFHLEFDTGMGRLGFYPDELPEIIQMLHANNLKPTGIMTHFATAETPDSAKVVDQIKQFEGLKNQLLPIFPNVLFHASNSGGTLYYYEAQYDIVRTGIALYGYGPDGTENGLQPVLSWKSYVAACKPIRKGMTVSYGATWIAPVDGYLLVVPVGYADGIPRVLSGKMLINVDGIRIKQVGNITMDYIMLYHTQSIETGTEVEVLGKNSMNASDWAEMAGTIPYEILCGIHPKIKRLTV